MPGLRLRSQPGRGEIAVRGADRSSRVSSRLVAGLCADLEGRERASRSASAVGLRVASEGRDDEDHQG